MKLLKFGGKSLANGKGSSATIDIIKEHASDEKEALIVVVSARGKTTDQLTTFLEESVVGKLDESELESFLQDQLNGEGTDLLQEEFLIIQNILHGASLMGDYSSKTKDLLLAQGEIMSAKYIQYQLNKIGIDSIFADSRKIIRTNERYGNAVVDHEVSAELTQNFFSPSKDKIVYIVTGFIGAEESGHTTTLGGMEAIIPLH